MNPIRGPHGRFCSSNPEERGTSTSISGSSDEDEGIIPSSVHRRQKYKLFDEYLKAFCVVGDSKDWVPKSSRTGPVVSTYEHVMSRKFRLSRSERADIMLRQYKDLIQSGLKGEISRISTRGSANSRGSRVTVYRYRRVPIVLVTLEMNALQKWAKEVGILKASQLSADEIYSFCRGVCLTYNYDSERPWYKGYPANAEVDAASQASNPSRSAQNAASGIMINRRENIQSSSVLGGNREMVSIRQNELVPDPNDDDMKELAYFAELAKSDACFSLLSVVLDERRKPRVDFVCSMLYKNVLHNRGPFTPVISDALKYANASLDGSGNRARQEELGNMLRDVLSKMKTFRELCNLSLLGDTLEQYRTGSRLDE